MNLVGRVRRHCQDISSDLRHLTINYETIASYSQDLNWPGLPVNSTASSAAPDVGTSATAPDIEQQRLLVLALDAINFGSGWHDVIAKRPGLSGARSMAAALTTFAHNSGGLTPQTLAKLDVGRCVEIFGQDPGNTETNQLMVHFANALNQLGKFIKLHGSTGMLIESAERSAVRFAEILSTMNMFNDVGYYKRAQIAAADLARNSLAAFDDLADLTAFADNLVPHVLAVDGVLTLDVSLRNQIARAELLQPQGRAEAELRAAAVHVVDLISDQRPDLRAIDVDQLLWERGGQALYKAQPRPRCRNIYY